MINFKNKKVNLNLNYFYIIIFFILLIMYFETSERIKVLELKIDIQNKKIKELNNQVENIENDF